MATITKAIADYSIAVGHGSSARGKYGVSLGSQSSQMHEGSVSIGYNADAGLILGNSSWTEQSTNGSAWSDITYNTPSEGTYVDRPIFVAVSNGSTTSVMVSDDGENWNAYNTSGTNLSWNAITSAVPNTGTYDDKTLFVAVGSSGDYQRIMTSPNGVTWTKRTATTNDWKDITHGIPREGIYIDTTVFVAVSDSNADGLNKQVITSNDGITWTSQDTLGMDSEWSSITSGVILDESTDINTTLFIAVSNVTNAGYSEQIKTTTQGFNYNGFNWTFLDYTADISNQDFVTGQNDTKNRTKIQNLTTYNYDYSIPVTDDQPFHTVQGYFDTGLKIFVNNVSISLDDGVFDITNGKYGYIDFINFGSNIVNVGRTDFIAQTGEEYEAYVNSNSHLVCKTNNVGKFCDLEYITDIVSQDSINTNLYTISSPNGIMPSTPNTKLYSYKSDINTLIMTDITNITGSFFFEFPTLPTGSNQYGSFSQTVSYANIVSNSDYVSPAIFGSTGVIFTVDNDKVICFGNTTAIDSFKFAVNPNLAPSNIVAFTQSLDSGNFQTHNARKLISYNGAITETLPNTNFTNVDYIFLTLSGTTYIIFGTTSIAIVNDVVRESSSNLPINGRYITSATQSSSSTTTGLYKYELNYTQQQNTPILFNKSWSQQSGSSIVVVNKQSGYQVGMFILYNSSTVGYITSINQVGGDYELEVGTACSSSSSGNDLFLIDPADTISTYTPQAFNFYDAINVDVYDDTIKVFDKVDYGFFKKTTNNIYTPVYNINHILKSNDAIEWTMATYTSLQPSISICSGIPNTGTYANKTLFVALNENGSVVYSTNGSNWIGPTSPIGGDWTKINSGTINGITVFIAVGNFAGNDGVNRIMTSFDGYTWNLETTTGLTNVDKHYTSVVSGIPGKGTQGTYSGESIFVAISKDSNYTDQVVTSNFSSKNSLAIGTNATTGGESSVAFGYGATTNNSHNAIAIGKGTIGMADHSIVLGTDASANGLYNIAIGYKAGANINTGTENCISIGNNASVTHMNCIAIGNGSKTTSQQSVAIGNDATADTVSMAIGSGAKSTGYMSCAVGSGADATEANTVAVGSAAEAKGADSIAIGKGANTGTYTKSIALGTDSTVTADNVICLGDGTQNVGIGVTNPNRELDVDGSVKITNWFRVTGNGGIHWEDWSGGWYMNDSTFLRTHNSKGVWAGNGTIATNGKMGIGTTAPNYPLHVSTNVAATANAKSYFSINTTNITYYNPSPPHFANIAASIYAASDIWTTAAFIATSDRRIKKNITDIQDDTSLEKLRLLKPSYYEYIDNITRTSSIVEGFIAQEVKEVLPYAVKIQEDYIPNIYCFGNYDSNTNVITLIDCSLNTSEFEKDASDNYFAAIKVYDPSNNETIIQMTDILNETQFKIEIPDNLIDEIFVYGQKVNNLNVLSKDSIFTVATSALQEVDRQQQADKQRIATLESQLASVLARLDALENP